MITDRANLGPSLNKGTSDLGASRGAEKPEQSAAAKLEKPDKANSFDQIFQKQVDKTRSEKPEQKNVRAPDAKPQAKQEPKPVQSNLEKLRPGKPNSVQAADSAVEKAQMSSNKNEPRTARKEKEDWENEEPGSVRNEESKEKVGEKANSGSTPRENVMLKFMDSMESEFGIPPQKLVEAMTHIPKSDQTSAPEDSASQVIGQLDLPPEQEQRALAMYMGMLAALRQPAEATPKAFVMASAATASAGPTALMAHQERTSKLNNSLDSMNSKFFMKGPKETSEALVKNNDINSMEKNPEKNPETNAFQSDGLKGALQPEVDGEKISDFMTQKGEAQNLSLNNPELNSPDGSLKKYGPAIPKFDLQSVDPNSEEAKELMKRLAVLGSAATALNQEIKADPKTLQALKAEHSMQALNATASSSSAGSALGGMGADSESGDDGGNLDGDQSSNQQAALHGNHGKNLLHTRGEAALATTSFGEALAASKANVAGGSEKQESVQQLMKQAQYMIKKGGGEAKITMNPEGLGEIHMKITVNDGKVNLEMSAQTKEAKKLIEGSLDELKSGLSQHKLSIEHVKVDVGNQMAGDSNSESQKQQRQMDMNRDQSKDQARQFWSQFNDNGGFDRRGTFFDNPAIRAYSGTKQVDALTPSSAPSVEATRAMGSGKGRGLNLVA